MRSCTVACNKLIIRRLIVPDSNRLRNATANGIAGSYRPGTWTWLTGLSISVLGQPTVLVSSEQAEVLKNMPKAAFFAVHTGRKRGIYSTWAEAETQVKGYPGAKFKKFPSESAALKFINDSSSNPYSSSSQTSLGSTTSEKASGPVPSGTDKKTSETVKDISDLTHISSKDLRQDMAELAEKGYCFSTKKTFLVYTDGSGLGNGKVGARAGLGVWWGEKGEAAERNLAERVPGKLQTNNRGELLSVIRALETCPYPHLPLEVRTDSQYTISCMTTYLPKWLKSNFRLSSSQASNYGGASSKLVKNTDLIKHLLVLLRRRDPKAGVKFRYVPAHVGWVGNEGADRLAKQGASSSPVPDRTDWLDPDKDDDSPLLVGRTENVDVQVQIDESWLMTSDELAALEADFALEEP